MRPFTFFWYFLGSPAAASVHPRQTNNATTEGFTKTGLLAMNDAMHKWVDAGHGSHVVTLLSRHGKIIDHDTYGVLDAQAPTKAPVKKDSIFRIMSMTKPVVGVAMMMFYEEGKWNLDDLVSKHIPEFANLEVKVCSTANGTSCTTQPANMEMTMAQLMSHSAGFPGQLTVSGARTLGDIIPPLKKGGLAFQPGKDWRYGPGVEIQGYLIQKWSSKDLSDFLQEKLLQPLGMVDTGFFIDPSKVPRLTTVHTSNSDSQPLSSTSSMLAAYANTKKTTKPVRLDPSGGLYSTAEDYWKFSQMLLNSGELNGRRYLKADTVKLMHTNVLEPQVRVKFGSSKGEGVGFGLDFAIVLDQVASKNNMPKDSFYWGGAYGTWFWIDPVNDVVFIGLISVLGADLEGSSSLRQLSAKGAYAALSR
jgi:CubicO group peptidase (beta-lactamase class C family)